MDRLPATRSTQKRGARSGGRAAIVTGASRGIGYAIARALLERKVRVAICARDEERLAGAASALAAHGEVYAQPADVSRAADVRRFVRRAADEIGPIEILVNNAGRVWSGDFERQSLESIDRVIDTNVKGLMYATRQVLAGIPESGEGVIINIASGAGLAGVPGIAVYSASKSAVLGFTQALAGELRPRSIRVYAVCPGRVATDMQEEYSGRRVGMPPDRVADAVLRLIDPRTGARSGTCLEL